MGRVLAGDPNGLTVQFDETIDLAIGDRTTLTVHASASSKALSIRTTVVGACQGEKRTSLRFSCPRDHHHAFYDYLSSYLKSRSDRFDHIEIVDERSTMVRWRSIFDSSGTSMSRKGSIQQLLTTMDPDCGCAIINMRIAECNHASIVREFGDLGINVPLLFLTRHANVDLIVDLMRAGAFACLEESADGHSIFTNAKSALRLARRRHCRKRTYVVRLARACSLTDREREVVDLLIQGHPSKQIGNALRISKRTVDHHRANIMQKLEVDSIAQLVVLALHDPEYRTKYLASP